MLRKNRFTCWTTDKIIRELHAELREKRSKLDQREKLLL